MKKILYIFLAILFLGYLCYFLAKLPTGIPNKNELFTNDNIIIIDSVRINDTNSAYWYCYDLGISGYSTGRIGISESIDSLKQSSDILVSSYITELLKIDSLSLKIKFINYEVVKAPNKVRGMKIIIDTTGDYKNLIENRLRFMFPPSSSETIKKR